MATFHITTEEANAALAEIYKHCINAEEIEKKLSEFVARGKTAEELDALVYHQLVRQLGQKDGALCFTMRKFLKYFTLIFILDTKSFTRDAEILDDGGTFKVFRFELPKPLYSAWLALSSEARKFIANQMRVISSSEADESVYEKNAFYYFFNRRSQIFYANLNLLTYAKFGAPAVSGSFSIATLTRSTLIEGYHQREQLTLIMKERDVWDMMTRERLVEAAEASSSSSRPTVTLRPIEGLFLIKFAGAASEFDASPTIKESYQKKLATAGGSIEDCTAILKVHRSMLIAERKKEEEKEIDAEAKAFQEKLQKEN